MIFALALLGVSSATAQANDCEVLKHRLKFSQKLFNDAHNGILETGLEVDQLRRRGRPAAEIKASLEREAEHYKSLNSEALTLLTAIDKVRDSQCLPMTDVIQAHKVLEYYVDSGRKMHTEIVGN
jgi:hypothetical protein